jgi:hypothetical protein
LGELFMSDYLLRLCRLLGSIVLLLGILIPLLLVAVATPLVLLLGLPLVSILLLALLLVLELRVSLAPFDCADFFSLQQFLRGVSPG